MTETEANAPFVDVVLYAEFDIDKGSTLRESYPTFFSHYSAEFFADVMLPEGVHNREDDFTIFFLNRKTMQSPALIPAKQNDFPNASEFMYCLSVVRTTHDNTLRRGARIKAVAICSRFKWCLSFKSLLDLAARKIAGAASPEASSTILHELYSVINSIDISGAHKLTEMEQRLMKRSISDYASQNTTAKSAEETFYHTTHAEWNEFKIPIRFKLCSSDDQHDEGLVRDLLATFGEQTMLLYNSVLTGARIIILGYNQPAGLVCNYVLAASALVCPPLFGLCHRQFPYANLNDLSFLSVPGYIAGVTNPMFKIKREWWDILCDISTGEVMTSGSIDKEESDVLDKFFIQDVLDGARAEFSEEWIRCRFEDYTRTNVIEIAFGEVDSLDNETHVKRTALNNKRITKWARTENYKAYCEKRAGGTYQTGAFDVNQTGGIDLRKHVRKLQGNVTCSEEEMERMYTDFVSILQNEKEMQEFISYLSNLRGGLESVVQGLFHPAISVKYNTVILCKRMEGFASTQPILQCLNPYLMIAYQRLSRIVQPEMREARSLTATN